MRLWLRRFEKSGPCNLFNRSKAPKNCPHKINSNIEKQILEARKKVPCYGPKRLKWFFKINAFEGAIYRVLKQNKLTRKRRKKYQKKNDLREEKAKYKALSHHQLNVKHLYDIPHYWTQMKKYNLPKYQYTIRDTKSGMIYLGYGKEYSQTYSILFVERYLNILNAIGITGEEITIQTDNGSEFGGRYRHLDKNKFVEKIRSQGANHKYIPPGMCNANADVESLHNTIEEELFDIENYSSNKTFMNKTTSYQLFYNLVRPNFSKKGKTPMKIIEEDRKGNFLNLLQETVDLDQLFRINYKSFKGGQYLPELPAFQQFPTKVI